MWRAFFRVFALHFTMMHALAAWAWYPNDFTALSSAVITHAICTALERYANWYMTRPRTDPLVRVNEKAGWLSGNFFGKSKKGKGKKSEEKDAEDADSASAPKPKVTLSDREGIARRHKRRQAFHEDEAPVWGFFGFGEWVVLAFGVTAFYVMQYMGPMTKIASDFW